MEHVYKLTKLTLQLLGQQFNLILCLFCSTLGKVVILEQNVQMSSRERSVLVSLIQLYLGTFICVRMYVHVYVHLYISLLQ